ncbi:maleylacetoacetate isomerase [Halocynthiibacter sp.]|uniref:maleylacetoacetate isomerase n=1 Tax=Halocynthiibacter sp. TaxID=1979210 RepID=UPI003C46F2E0
MKLYSYWRSTTSFRVRIALHMKGVAFETLPVDLVKGEQRAQDYQAINPGKGVPALVLDDGTVLTQSLAILDYLERVYPEPVLLPADPIERAKMQAAAHAIALDVHPVNNLRVGGQLKALGRSQDEVVTWMNHWMTEGFTAFQSMIKTDTKYAFSDVPSLADVCLVAQLYNAHRWGTDMKPFARLLEIEQACLALPAFDAARPENQPDAG